MLISNLRVMQIRAAKIAFVICKKACKRSEMLSIPSDGPSTTAIFRGYGVYDALARTPRQYVGRGCIDVFLKKRVVRVHGRNATCNPRAIHPNRLTFRFIHDDLNRPRSSSTIGDSTYPPGVLRPPVVLPAIGFSS